MEKFKILSNSLLDLHTELLEFEKKQYEGVYGRIENSGQYFGVVMNHPAFQWLRTLSQLIVVYDEFIKDETVSDKRKMELMEYTRGLLTPDQNGSEFARKYFVAMQNYPEIVVAHGKVMRILKD